MIKLVYFFMFVGFNWALVGEDPVKILNQARENVNNSLYLTYRQQALYPNPAGLHDTISARIFIHKNQADVDEYDFMWESASAVEVSLNGQYKSVNHKKKVVNFFTEKESEQQHIRDSRNTIYSPLKLLNQQWKFVSDTLAGSSRILNFFRIETDTVVNGNKIYTEQHIFINSATKLLEKFERRNYFKGNLSQTIRFNYSDYTVSNSQEKLSYTFPEGYVSEPFEKSNSGSLLEVGDKAIAFKKPDINGNVVDLTTYSGKKTLLIFSAINCGYCKLALEYITNPDFEFDESISIIQLNPNDENVALQNYLKNFPNPFFPVLSKAGNIAELYGVSGYPTFFLLNEELVIERVEHGFNKEFLNSLRK